MKIDRLTWAAGLLATMALLCLALVVQPAAASTLGNAPADGPDCDNPPTGRRARLLGDSEIAITWRADQYKNLAYGNIDDTGENLVWGDVSDDTVQTSNLTDIRWPAVTMADMNGDGKDQMVLAYRDRDQAVGAALVIPHEGMPSSLDQWYGFANDDRQGKHVAWIDVAAGNLNGRTTGDGDDEVALAFADDTDALQVLVLGEEWFQDNNREPMAVYRDPSTDGRGEVKYVAVATGDLDGDGYDNEIVVAFQDGSKHLQAVILKMKGGTDKEGTLKLLWSRPWQDHYRQPDAQNDHAKNARPVDVTTGDIDGDYRDEVIIGFRDGDLSNSAWGNVQLLVLDRQESDGSYDDSTFTHRSPRTDLQCPDPYPPSVSVATADLDGDGAEEIALAYAGVCADGGNATVQLMTYEGAQFNQWGWPELTLKARPGHWAKRVGTSGNYRWSGPRPYFYLSVDAGDMDRDGEAEIALAYTSDKGEIYVQAFDAASGLTPTGSIASKFNGADSIQEFWLAMGDMDGDSLYSTYTGKCYQNEDVYPSALVHAPPHWLEDEHNSSHADAEFKTTLKTEQGEKHTSETGYGGSVKMGVEFLHMGYSATYDYEKSVATENGVLTAIVDSVGLGTCSPFTCGEDAYYEAVGYNMCPRWCFEYVDDEQGLPITVCTPRPADECEADKANIDYWYRTLSAKYPDSWVPLGMNLARGKAAEQSSTAYDGVASRAVDGDTDGDYAKGSITFAQEGPNPWWQVDLGTAPTVHALQLWNRSDGAPEVPARLSDFYVFVSKDPFASTIPDETKAQPGVWHYYHEGAAERLTTIAFNELLDPEDKAPERSREVEGRYVRVQLAGDYRNPLSLAEVQVWGALRDVDQWPTDKPVPDDATFKIKLRDGTEQVVEGQHVYSWQGAKLGVNPGGAATWSTAQDKTWEQATEWSTASSSKLGLELVFLGGDYAMSSKEVKSRIMAWSKETEFAGAVGPVHADEESYNYAPYVWLQQATAKGGTEQAFLVVDYWVPSMGLSGQEASTSQTGPTAGVAPKAPRLESTSHPDPEDWYAASTATFKWRQPNSDKANVVGYRWHLDGLPDTIPSPFSQGLIKTQTYENLSDGIWYLHVRALGDDGQWGETSHLAIRIDAEAPVVELALDPPLPTGHDNWYSTPVTVTATALDGFGSGVTAVQVSTDGTDWQPYAGPWRFENDTTETTVWARATDAAGHRSEPVSATFKIDRTPPTSKVPAGGPMPGAWVAEVMTDTLGNDHLVLAGTIDDAHAGRAGLDLRAKGLDWMSADSAGAGDVQFSAPGVDVNWSYTATTSLGRGNHTFYGQAHDRAGNVEDTYEMAQVVWFPKSAPDLVGSDMMVWPTVARPGDEVAFVIAARNGGYQEAWVQVSDKLPAGLSPVMDSLGADVAYDSGTRTITWPPRLLWPGEAVRLRFRAQVGGGLGATTLENQATARAFWPNSGDLPEAERQRFTDKERAVNLKTTLTVAPGLAAGTDVTAPWASLDVHSGQVVGQRAVQLTIQAADDASRMYLREWTLDPDTGTWQIARNSGWLAYSRTQTWTLSPGNGIKYLGVWVADEAGNVSTLDEHSLAFTNLVGGSQNLADGQRAQYRFDVPNGAFAGAYVTALGGDPDLYVWMPHHTFRPTHFGNGTGTVDEVSGWVQEPGICLIEIAAVGDSQYALRLREFDAAEQGGQPQTTMVPLAEKARPMHPLSVSDPLSAGPVEPPAPGEGIEIYLPLAFRGS